MNDFTCANCKHGKKYRADCEWEYMYDGTDYANDCCDWWKPTNADRIRAMTDEQLADYLRYYSDSYALYDMDWLDWLKQESD